MIDNNYKLLIIFQQVDVYFNKPIKVDELIKLATTIKITTIVIFESKK